MTDTLPIDPRNVTPNEIRRYLWIIAWSGLVEVHVDPATQTATIKAPHADK